MTAGIACTSGAIPIRTAPRGEALAGLRGVDAEVMGELMATGAVVAGRQTVELAGGWGGDHHDGVPIFVYSRRPPAAEAAQWPLATYLDDVAEAMARGREAAGDKDVLVHGAATAQAALAAGVLDELQIHLVPVLLGQGRRLFEDRRARQARAHAGGGGHRSHPPPLSHPPVSGAAPGTPQRAARLGAGSGLETRVDVAVRDRQFA